MVRSVCVMSALVDFMRKEFPPYFRHPNKKPWLKQLREITSLTTAYRYPPYQYFNVGLYDSDATDAVSDYMPSVFVSRYREPLNGREGCKIIRDKQVFSKVMRAGGAAVVGELLVIDPEGRMTGPEGDPIGPAEAAAILARHGGEVFVKPLSGRFGLGAEVIGPEGHAAFLAAPRPDVIVQPRLVQHPDLAALHPASVNTIRIDTLKTESGFVHNAAVLRIGAGGNIVDNARQGGFFVGVDLETGALQRLARGRSKFGTARVTRHPDTGVVFDGRLVPLWDSVLATVDHGAEILLTHGLQSIGWDVAVLPEGACIVEANAGWNVSTMQVGWGGLARTEIGRRALAARSRGRAGAHAPGAVIPGM